MEFTVEAKRPQDGSTIRRWSRSTCDYIHQLTSTEDRYDLVRDGEIIHTEHFTRSPALRWYTQQQATRLYEEAGLRRLHLFKGFSREPATPDDLTFTILGIKP